jgi:hypothetical protein
MARVYTSRQLLDPSILQMRQQADDAYLQRQQQQRQNFYNSLQTGANALGKAIGQGIDAYRDYSKNQEDMAKRRELLGNYNLQGPEEAAIGEEYERTGDPSKLLTLRQIKEANDARKAQLEESKLERAKNEAFHKSVRLAQARPEYAATQKQMFDAIDAGDFETANIYASKLKAYETEFGTEPFGGAAETAKINRMKTAEAKKLAEEKAKAEQEAADKAEAERQYRVADYLTKIPTTFKDEDAKTEWYEYIRNNVDMTPSEKASEINNLRNIETGKTKMKKASQSAAASAAGDETKKGIEDTKNKSAAQAYVGKKLNSLEWNKIPEEVKAFLKRDAMGNVEMK